jgi:hypothetical protein
MVITLSFSPHPSFLQAKMPPRANLLANFAGLFTVPRRGRLIAASPLKGIKISFVVILIGDDGKPAPTTP